MKTTLELPDELMKRVKLRALHEGKKLKDTAAELLRMGLAAGGKAANGAKKMTGPRIRTDKKTGIPVIQCRRIPSRGRELTPQRVAEILADQESEWARDFG
jgi:hypothetical protein